jgi:septal ring factor EnvC (AmiA/AmiB activator)
MFMGLWLVAGMAAAAMAQSQAKKEELEKVQKQIVEKQKQLKKLETQERNFFARLEEMQKKQEALENDVMRLGREEKQLVQKQAQTQKEKVEKQKSIDRQKDFMRAHMTQLYTHGQMNVLENLFSRASISEKQNQQVYIQKWVAAQDQKVKAFQRELEALDAIKRKLAEQEAQKRALALALEKQRSELKQEEKGIQVLLASVKGKKENYRKTLQELEAASQKIQKFLEKMQQQSTVTGSAFAQSRGQLLYPVPGKVMRRYGPYEDKTLKAKLYHKGMDFKGALGDPIRSIFQGRVVFAGWFEGYGKVVIVDHGQGYHSLYAHLHEMKVARGDQITTQSVLGTIGESGSLQGPYLYFELRKKGVTVDPSSWFGS